MVHSPPSFDCPARPNCVSSKSRDRRRRVKPLRYTKDPERAREDLLAVLSAMKRMEIVENQKDYLHVTFSSPVFGFVDDTEFLFDDADKVIHIRSAARSGYYDFGVNRRRARKIYEAFSAVSEAF